MNFKTTVILLVFAIVSFEGHANPAGDKNSESTSITGDTLTAKTKRESSPLELNHPLKTDDAVLKLDEDILRTQGLHTIHKRGLWKGARSRWNNRKYRLAQKVLRKAEAKLRYTTDQAKRRKAVVARAKQQLQRVSQKIGQPNAELASSEDQDSNEPMEGGADY